MIDYTQLGAHRTQNGVRFTVFSQYADKIELCLFSDDEKKEERIALQKGDNHIWAVDLANIFVGQKYGFRAHGAYNPNQGLYFNSAKVLIDPFSKEISKSVDDWENPALRDNNSLDNAFLMPKSVVVFEDEASDRKKYPYLHKKLKTDWKDTIIYEAHVKGFSIQNIHIPVEMRGKFTAFCHPQVIGYLKNLGVTHVELLPVTPSIGGLHLKKELGLSDYWGYNPMNHFALDSRYGTRDEFKQMVNALHQAGIEVGLDVVYNHSGEFGSCGGNMLCYKGLDSPNYYRLAPDGSYIDTTGCGNSLNPNTDAFAGIIEASLRSFSRELGVDGFRFDLAADCALDSNHRFDKNSRFMQIIHKIQMQEGVKISGEPWSALGGYYRGEMGDMMEWNDKHKEAVRRFYRGDSGVASLLANQISGREGIGLDRNETKYIRYTAVHDGFTVYDSVTHYVKNNWANNENNQDGNNEEYVGVVPNEEMKFRRIKSMMACNVFSRGVPLICHGDEIGRSQQGNNNAYCQDNEISWQNWSHLTSYQKDLYLFLRKAIALRKKYPALANLRAFNAGQESENCPEVVWLRPDGQEMQSHDWDCSFAKTLAFKIKSGVEGQDLVVLLSGYENDLSFQLPQTNKQTPWEVLLNTAQSKMTPEFVMQPEYVVPPYSFVMLRQTGKSRV